MEHLLNTGTMAATSWAAHCVCPRAGARGLRATALIGLAYTALLGVAPQVLAQQAEAPAIYGEIGRVPRGTGNTDVWAVGVMLPSRPAFWNTRWYWDVFASQWRAPNAAGTRGNHVQIGSIATLRYHFDSSGSPWFVEGGLGGTLMNKRYVVPEREFSTCFQFTELVGVGRSFGDQGQHELSLRVQHFSNGGIKKPNPGENFVRIRYAHRF